MQLAKRLFLFNLLAVLVTLAVTFLAATIYIAVYTAFVDPEASLGELKQAVQLRQTMHHMQKKVQNMPFEQLLNQAFQEELSGQLLALGADALILHNGQLLYSTAPFSDMEIQKRLLLTKETASPDTFNLDGQTYLYVRIDYSLPTGEEGNLFLFAPLMLKNHFYISVAIFTAVIFFITFLALNSWVTLYFSRGIIGPVSRLKEAATKISEGDLNWEIAEEGEEEIRELCRTLELMRIRLKESLLMQQKYDENRSFLVSSISHDLKTPVTSIIGYIDGILDGVAQTPEKMNHYLLTARTKARQVNAMIDDLLLYSKLDLNQIQYHFETTDLEEYFKDCVDDHQYHFSKENIKLTLENQLEKPALVRIDREKMKRVIQNGLDNAKRYMDKQEGQVKIILRETPASYIIEIWDNGPGIAEEHLPHIFDRFYRADSARKSDDGSGLGLAIAKQIVEDHQGHIWVRSKVGEGTSLLIALNKREHLPLPHGGVGSNEKNFDRGR